MRHGDITMVPAQLQERGRTLWGTGSWRAVSGMGKQQ